MRHLKTFYCQEIEKWLRCHRLLNWWTIRKCIQANCNRRNSILATGLFPCDKNTFKPYDFPLSSEDKDAAPVNHPALVKTCDQPTFSSAKFLPFTLAEALQPSDISPVPSLNLKPNPCGGTGKENNKFTLQKICWGNSEKENKTGHSIQNHSACVKCSSWSFK